MQYISVAVANLAANLVDVVATPVGVSAAVVVSTAVEV